MTGKTIEESCAEHDAAIAAASERFEAAFAAGEPRTPEAIEVMDATLAFMTCIRDADLADEPSVSATIAASVAALDAVIAAAIRLDAAHAVGGKPNTGAYEARAREMKASEQGMHALISADPAGHA